MTERIIHWHFYKLLLAPCPCGATYRDILIHKNYEYCRICRRKTSAKSELKIFKSSNLSYSQIAKLLICYSKNLSPKETKKIIHIDRTTAYRWYKKIDNSSPKEKIIIEKLVSKFATILPL